ncbi:hypothetical protein A8713_30955 [Streptomyces sp. SAT1]|nr:hypothetical protein A8713_30955 [Streptomyces sp. SAT1]
MRLSQSRTAPTVKPGMAPLLLFRVTPKNAGGTGAGGWDQAGPGTHCAAFGACRASRGPRAVPRAVLPAASRATRQTIATAAASGRWRAPAGRADGGTGAPRAGVASGGHGPPAGPSPTGPPSIILSRTGLSRTAVTALADRHASYSACSSCRDAPHAVPIRSTMP